MLAHADVAVAASLGPAPAPGLVVRALGAGAVPVVSRLRAYEEVLGDGDVGLLFEPGDVDVLAGQLERLAPRPRAARPPARRRWRTPAAGCRGAASPTRWRRSTPSWPPAAGRASGDPELRARLRRRPLIDVDLHMHTDHSGDCATPVEVLLATARDRGLGAIAVTDHNEISGALDARAKAAEYGVKVIVGEEVKTADQGEVIGLFIEEKIPRGLSARRRRSPRSAARAGSSTSPTRSTGCTPSPTTSTCWPWSTTSTRSRSSTRAMAIRRSTRRPCASPASTGSSPGAGSDAHVAQGLGSVRDPDARLRRPRGVPRVAARRRHHRQAVLAVLRAGAEVPPDAGDARRRRRATRRRQVKRAVAARDGLGASRDAGQGEPAGAAESAPAACPPPTTRSARSTSSAPSASSTRFTRELQACEHCPRGNLMPVLGSGHPQADVFLLKYAPTPSEIEEGVAFYGRAGHRADEVAASGSTSTRSPSTGRCA